MTSYLFRRMVLAAAVLVLSTPPLALAQARGNAATAPANGQTTRSFFIGPDLALYETAPTTVTVGQTATFTFHVVNVGTTGVSKAKVDTHLPSNVSLTNISMPFGAWGCGGSFYVNLSCYFYGGTVVPPGGSFPAFQISGQVVTPGQFHICSSVSIPSGPGDVNHVNDQSCVNGTVQPKPKSDLAVLKTGPGIATSGLGANFAITIHNAGPSSVNAQSGITVTDTLLASGLTGPVTASGPGWACTVAGMTVTCAYNGAAVASGANLLPIAIHAKAGTTGPHYNCAVVGMSGGDDTNTGNNRGCVDFEVRLAHAGPSRN